MLKKSALFSTFILAGLAPFGFAATLPYDQANVITPFIPGSYVVDGSFTVAQTFRVGITGTLGSVEVQAFQLQPSTPPTADLIMDIRRTVNGHPADADSPVLASRVFHPSDVPTTGGGDFITFDVRPFQISVHAGDQLAIVLSSSTPNGALFAWYSWASTLNQDTYANGSVFRRELENASGTTWVSASGDLGFRTTVVPLPSAAWSGLPLTAALILLRWKKSARANGTVLACA